MASGQTSALASARKKRGKRVLPHPPSNRKLTMKYIELDRDNQFHNLSETGDEYSVGGLYQVTHYNKKEHAFEFTAVKRVGADIELTPEQSRILGDMSHLRDETIEEYLLKALLDQLQADVHREYRAGDPRRDAALIATQHSWKRYVRGD